MSKNFHCNKCGKDFFIPTYVTTYTDKNIIFKTKNRRNLLSCDYCESINIEKIETLNGLCINHGKFASASHVQKQEILKKRADFHNKKPSIHEEKKHREMVQVKKTIGNINK